MTVANDEALLRVWSRLVVGVLYADLGAGAEVAALDGLQALVAGTQSL